MSWYGGEEAGTALADVLFGDYNPAGRLPVTFYRSLDQLPPFENYSMAGRTYRYFEGDPVYPFGFGISYTTFAYDGLKIAPERVEAGQSVQVSATVTNTGEVAGDEVVQVYLRDVAASVPAPIRKLAGFRRVRLEPGQREEVSFTLKSEQMSVRDDEGKPFVEPGEFEVSVGGGQPLPATGEGGFVIGGFEVVE